MVTVMLHFYRIGVFVEGFKGFLYTDKFVKSLLLRILPEKEDLFKPSRSGFPKLIHVSPLYSVRGGRVKCIYSSIECNGDTARCSGKPSLVELNGYYFFYTGFWSRVLDNDLFVERLMDVNECFEFMGQKVCVVVNEFEYVNPLIASDELAHKVIKTGKLKIIFASPTMLRDPFKRTKHKSLLPTVFNVFSTPVFLMLHMHGTYSLKKYRRQLLILHKLFNESYSVLKTVKLK